MTRRHSITSVRPLFGGVAAAILAALVLTAAACSLSSGTDPSTPVVNASGTSATTVADTAPTGGESPPTIDGVRVLADAIGTVGTRYTFDSSVELTSGTLTLASGRVYDDSSAYLITTVGSEVEYVITPDGRWVREPGSDWVTFTETAPVSDPLAALGSPDSIDVTSVDGGTVVLVATYDPAALGFTGLEPVDVAVTIRDGRLASLEYQAPVGQDTATVTTDIGSDAPVDPVVAPVPTG